MGPRTSIGTSQFHLPHPTNQSLIHHKQSEQSSEPKGRRGNPMKIMITQAHQNWWDKSPKLTEIEIEGTTPDEAYAKYFREYKNRNKYNNSVKFTFHDPDQAKAYGEWISDINNYANNGGDMW
tara:strand:- start:261 stop:629 length:369 start_codon:yes stop_codon:yes gene_type:complete